MMAPASVDLPLPLSPTTPRMLPPSMSRETPRRILGVACPDGQVADLDHRRRLRGSMASRSASPSRVNPSVAKASAPAAVSTGHAESDRYA